MKYPKKWYIEVTKENIDELNRWRLSKRQIEAEPWDFLFVPGAILLSEHPSEKSYFWAATESDLNESYPSYQKIILEQFRQITNSTPTQNL